MVKERFNLAKRQFDKTLKKVKRSYERSKVFELEQANIENPLEFRKSIAKLGPTKQHTIPMTVEDEYGNISCDVDGVFERWKNDFASLFATEENLSNEKKNLLQTSEMKIACWKINS